MATCKKNRVLLRKLSLVGAMDTASVYVCVCDRLASSTCITVLIFYLPSSTGDIPFHSGCNVGLMDEGIVAAMAYPIIHATCE